MRILLLLALLLPYGALAAESSAVSSPRAVATLISETDAVAPGQPYRVALRLRMAPGWHTYWRNPGDAGVAPELVFTLPEGVTAGPIAWPTPARQLEDTLMTFGYQGELVLPVMLSGGKGAVELAATWLVCEKICVPEEGRFRLDLPQGTPSPSREAPLFAAADARMPRPAPWGARIAGDGMLGIVGADFAGVAEAFFIPEQPDVIAASAKQAMDVGREGMTLKLTPAPAFKPEAALAGVLVLRDQGGMESAYTLTALPGPVAPAGEGVVRVIGFALLGGLILNLMPCVFPVLAMKAMGLARMSGQPRAAARRHAAAYAAGVLATFVGIAFLLLALRQAGDAVGWGFQFQSPVFVAGMALLLFAIGLNLSGLYEIGRGIGAGQGLAGRAGHGGSFFAGMLAVLVATPCTAPFMGVALTAGLSGSTVETVAVFVALGLGLAAPYVVLAVVPGFARLLPRPGRWMDHLRRILALPMYGAAGWMLWVLAQQVEPVVLRGAGAMLALALVGFWQIGRAQRGSGGRSGLAMAGVIALGIGGFLATMPTTPPAETSGPAVSAYSAARLAALRAAGTPVFVNMTAAWCVSCLVNERVALSREVVRDAMAAKGIVYLKGDWTRQDPAISAFLRGNGADGVPLYVFYPGGGGKPVVLPQILTPGIVLEALKAGA